MENAKLGKIKYT